ncbi:hypothetical protein DSO57_1020245 [Entomophthora muscae]|uniref:Uncharacterized protein n=1 Tax=Entomophthora muscae TaxID=34485 RepID=A0ACC2TF43_9FUNG|nr:hypothetical protein DSO57_1020245 [Entomophthora muscae]
MKFSTFATLLPVAAAVDVIDVRLAIQRKTWTGRTEYFIDLIADDVNVWHCNLDYKYASLCQRGKDRLKLTSETDSEIGAAITWNAHNFTITATFVSEQNSWFTPRYTNYAGSAMVE